MIIALAAPACVHITHTAEVQEGVILGVAGGVGSEHHTTTPATFVWDVQLNGGYGTRFSEDYALLVQALVPLTTRPIDTEPNQFHFAGLLTSHLDVYFQFVGGDLVDLGAGALIGGGPGGYLLIGHDYPVSGGDAKMRFDLGLSVRSYPVFDEPDFAVVPQMMLTFHTGAMSYGVLAEAAFYNEAVERSDEVRRPENQNIDRGVFVAFVIQTNR